MCPTWRSLDPTQPFSRLWVWGENCKCSVYSPDLLPPWTWYKALLYNVQHILIRFRTVTSHYLVYKKGKDVYSYLEGKNIYLEFESSVNNYYFVIKKGGAILSCKRHCPSKVVYLRVWRRENLLPQWCEEMWWESWDPPAKLWRPSKVFLRQNAVSHGRMQL